jgi:hypothetical protein
MLLLPPKEPVNSIQRAVVLFCLCVAPGAQQPVEPKFVEGQLSTLSCRVVDQKATQEAVQILTVEVQNRGSADAEPLEFRIEMAGKKSEPRRVETFARVQLPRIARHGRPTPAGGKQTYLVSTALPGKRGALTVQVASASWCENGRREVPDLQIGTPEQVQRTSFVGTFPVTQVALHNPFAQDLDVLMLVTLKQPIDCTELMGARIPANGNLAWLVMSRAGNRPYLDQTGGPAVPVKATEFRVVDWSLVGSPPADYGAKLLRPAYEAWYRWPEQAPQAAGDFVYRERIAKADAPGQYEDFLIKGRFTLDASRKIGVEVASGSGANPHMLLAMALENVVHPDFATLLAKNVLVPIAADRIALRGPGWDWNQNGGSIVVGGNAENEGEWSDLQVGEERILGDGHGDGPRSSWETRSMGRNQVVARRSGGSGDTQYSYGEQEGRIVPTAVTHIVTFGERMYSVESLELSNWQFEGVQPIVPEPPRGEGAQALRAMWDAAYHLPPEPIVIEGQFEISTPGTDFVWQGYKKLQGSMVMTGIGRRMRGAEFTFQGNLSYELQMSLAAIVRDRLLMWYGRDFNDRPSFDEFFQGADIHASTAEGDFVIDHSHVERVFTEGGLVRGWRFSGGGSTKFTYQKFGDRQAVTRIEQAVGRSENRSQERWNSSVSVALGRFGEHLLPVSLGFEHIFGRDWGPESIVWKNVKVR